MSIWQLVRREIRHRCGNFLLGVLAVAVAVGLLVAAELQLRRDRITTDAILSEKQAELEQAIAVHEAEVQKAGKELQDAIRKQMVKLGFNVLILPEQQELSELHLQGTLSETMPESYVSKLAESSIVTVNHLLPTVTKRLHWPEKDLDVILVGTRGEVPILHRKLKKPILDAVAPGEMVVGYSVHKKLGLQQGDKVLFQGREFTVSKLHPERGSMDDVTIWIDLATAQEMLGLQNLVHAILALECECAGDRISQIRQEIQNILPGTQVIERHSKALARAEARAQAKKTAELTLTQAKQEGQAALQREQDSREDLEQRHQALAAAVVPTVIAAAVIWIGLLTLLNVRQRRQEIGILRAMGVSSSQVLALFLSRAVLLGLVGGLLGLLLAGGADRLLSSQVSLPAELFAWPALLEDRGVFLTVVLAPLLAPFLSCLASWLPALAASREDPALVLQGE